MYGDRYRLVKKLGEGAYAAVFEATDKQTKKVYAVKITTVKNYRDAAAIRKEIEILGSLNHPNIIKYFITIFHN
jgi:serine/threonine protein kinase